MGRKEETVKAGKAFSAVVLAGGSGTRMGSLIPKQYIPLLGKPLIYYALKAFEESPVDEVVLVVPEGDVDYAMREVVTKYAFSRVTKIVEGGGSRAESVLKGLQASSGTYVLIHDGARPLLSQALIGRMMDGAVKYRACAASVPETNTVKVAGPSHFVLSTPDRKGLYSIQTPQAFDRDLILAAYGTVLKKGMDLASFTDDSMVVEKGSEEKVKLIEGEEDNLKVTRPLDLTIAEAILSGQGRGRGKDRLTGPSGVM